MAELVDATDLKSVEVNPRASSILASGTINTCINTLINKIINIFFPGSSPLWSTYNQNNKTPIKEVLLLIDIR